MNRLPTILKHEPLVDAVFEIRLSESAPLADILPGFLLRELDTKPKIIRLPAADLPHPVRSNDPSLQFTPIQRLELERYNILIGDRNFVIGCKLPYPKWPSFRTEILKIVRNISNANIEGKVQRYSVKYVNLLESVGHTNQLNKISINANLGGVEISEADHITLRLHQKENDIIHIMSVSTGAQAKISGRNVTGLVLDIDSIREISGIDFVAFSHHLEPGLDDLKEANKRRFFNCLTDETIEELGPVYD